MQRISHRNHIDADIPETLNYFIHRRYEQLVEDSGGEVIPVIILVEETANITGAGNVSPAKI